MRKYVMSDRSTSPRHSASNWPACGWGNTRAEVVVVEEVEVVEVEEVEEVGEVEGGEEVEGVEEQMRIKRE